MLLRARLFPLGDDSREILERLLPRKGAGPTNGRYPIAVGNRALPEILRAGDLGSGFWVSGEAVFSKSELVGVSHFELVCRKFVPESDRDYADNFATCEGAKLVNACAEASIRLATGFVLTRIALKPNMVGAIGEWTQEYVIGSGVARAFEKENFNRWWVKPVMNPKTQSPYSEFFQIFTDTVMQPAAIDCSVERIQSERPEENGQLRHLGCLSYAKEDLQGQADFARTAEPWGSWHGQPSWVVRSRVARAFVSHKLRGWAFRPVLGLKSDLCRKYLYQWQVLWGLVAKCSRCKFDGGRW